MCARRHSSDDDREQPRGLADQLARWDTEQGWMRATPGSGPSSEHVEPPESTPAQYSAPTGPRLPAPPPVPDSWDAVLSAEPQPARSADPWATTADDTEQELWTPPEDTVYRPTQDPPERAGLPDSWPSQAGAGGTSEPDPGALPGVGGGSPDEGWPYSGAASDRPSYSDARSDDEGSAHAGPGTTLSDRDQPGAGLLSATDADDWPPATQDPALWTGPEPDTGRANDPDWPAPGPDNGRGDLSWTTSGPDDGRAGDPGWTASGPDTGRANAPDWPAPGPDNGRDDLGWTAPGPDDGRGDPGWTASGPDDGRGGDPGWTTSGPDDDRRGDPDWGTSGQDNRRGGDPGRITEPPSRADATGQDATGGDWPPANEPMPGDHRLGTGAGWRAPAAPWGPPPAADPALPAASTPSGSAPWGSPASPGPESPYGPSDGSGFETQAPSAEPRSAAEPPPGPASWESPTGLSGGAESPSRPGSWESPSGLSGGPGSGAESSESGSWESGTASGASWEWPDEAGSPASGRSSWESARPDQSSPPSESTFSDLASGEPEPESGRPSWESSIGPGACRGASRQPSAAAT